MYRHGLSIIVEDNDLKKPTSPVGADIEVTVTLVEHADGVSYRMFYVEISDTVLTRAVGDLHICRVPCLPRLPIRTACGDVLGSPSGSAEDHRKRFLSGTASAVLVAQCRRPDLFRWRCGSGSLPRLGAGFRAGERRIRGARWDEDRLRFESLRVG